MASTEIDICNEALLYVGNSKRINDFTERTAEAIACAVAYGKTRDALLARAHWRFATKRSVLALSTEERTGWTYVYVLPADCVAPRYIWPGQRLPNPLNKIPFTFESSSSGPTVDGQVLLTDKAEAELIYTAQVNNTGLYPPLFVEALAWAMAAKLALVLPNKADLSLKMLGMAKASLETAAAAELNSTQEDVPPPSEFTTAR